MNDFTNSFLPALILTLIFAIILFTLYGNHPCECCKHKKENNTTLIKYD